MVDSACRDIVDYAALARSFATARIRAPCRLATYIAPLLPDDVTIDGLLGLSTAWRLNVTVEMGGVFALHAMQQSFDLTKKAE